MMKDLAYLQSNPTPNVPYVIFVLGPLTLGSNYNTWNREQDTRAAEEACVALWNEGFSVLCPQAADRFLPGAVSEDILLAGYIEQFKRCDGILVLAGWQNSESTITCLDIAHELMIPKFFSLENLLGWFAKYRATQ